VTPVLFWASKATGRLPWERLKVDILLFTNLFPNSEDPNYGIFVYRRAHELQKIFGHSVRVVAPVPYFPKWLHIPARLRAMPRIARWLQMSRIPDRERLHGIDVHHPRYFVLPNVSVALHGFLMFLGAISTVARLHRRRRFDCLDAHFVYPDGLAAILIGKSLRLPVVITAHGTDLNHYPKFPLLRPLLRWTLQSADRVICVSTPLKQIALSLKVPNDRIVVIPNGIDLKLFYPADKAESRLRLGIVARAKVILAVAQLIPRKGHISLIQAVACLRKKLPDIDVQLFIVGEGDLSEILRKEILALVLERHVFLKGPVKNEELFRWYSAADVTCLPSSGEGLPCALLESLACGTPVVATGVGGVPELINSSDLGILVKQDISSISSGLERALETTWDRGALARHVGRYTWAETAVEIEKGLAYAVKQKPKGTTRTTLAEPTDQYVAEAK
jgi:glycosyltransferase involved in cell wall biosynthesis